jgi:hypothetical protein
MSLDSIGSVPKPDQSTDPIEAIALWMEDKKWPFRRPSDDELLSDIRGEVSTYSVCYRWHSALELMTFVSAFPYQPPKKTHTQADKLILLINECLPIGHFERRPDDGAVYYRCSSFFPGGEISDSQAHRLLTAGLGACDGYYPAFNLVSIAIPAERAFHEGRMLSETEGNA